MPKEVFIPAAGVTVQVPDEFGPAEIQTIAIPGLLKAGVIQPQHVGLNVWALPKEETPAGGGSGWPLASRSLAALTEMPVPPSGPLAPEMRIGPTEDQIRAASAAAGPLPGNEPPDLTQILEPETLTPAQRDAATQLDQLQRGRYSRGFLERGLAPPSEITPADVAIGRTLDEAGRRVEASVADVANIPAAVAGYTKPFENIMAADEGRPLPTAERLQQAGAVGIPGRVALAAAEVAPRAAAAAALTSLGMPGAMSDAAVFGFDERGFNPQMALTMAAVPLVHKLGVDATSKLLADRMWMAKRIVEQSVENPAAFTVEVQRRFPALDAGSVQKIVENASGAGTSWAFLTAAQLPEVWDAPDRNGAILDLAIRNAAFAVGAAVGGYRPEGLSQAQADVLGRLRSGRMPPGLEVRTVRPTPLGRQIPEEAAPAPEPMEPTPPVPSPRAPVPTTEEPSAVAGAPTGSGVTPAGDVMAPLASTAAPSARPEPQSPGTTEIPSFAKPYDPETLMQRPGWVAPGSAFDRVLGDLRERQDPFYGRDVTPVWQGLTPEQRQDLVARGWVPTSTRKVGQVELHVSDAAAAAGRFYAAQKRLSNRRIESAKVPITEPALLAPITTGVQNAEAIRGHQGQLPPLGQAAQGGEAPRGHDLESPSSGRPEPVEPGAPPSLAPSALGQPPPQAQAPTPLIQRPPLVVQGETPALVPQPVTPVAGGVAAPPVEPGKANPTTEPVQPQPAKVPLTAAESKLIDSVAFEESRPETRMARGYPQRPGHKFAAGYTGYPEAMPLEARQAELSNDSRGSSGSKRVAVFRSPDGGTVRLVSIHKDGKGNLNVATATPSPRRRFQKYADLVAQNWTPIAGLKRKTADPNFVLEMPVARWNAVEAELASRQRERATMPITPAAAAAAGVARPPSPEEHPSDASFIQAITQHAVPDVSAQAELTPVLKENRLTAHRIYDPAAIDRLMEVLPFGENEYPDNRIGQAIVDSGLYDQLLAAEKDNPQLEAVDIFGKTRDAIFKAYDDAANRDDLAVRLRHSLARPGPVAAPVVAGEALRPPAVAPEAGHPGGTGGTAAAGQPPPAVPGAAPGPGSHAASLTGRQAVGTIAAVRAALDNIFGGEVPEHVTVVFDPAWNQAGDLDRSTGQITLNAAHIPDPAEVRRVLQEELVHAVRDDPAVAREWKALLDAVTPEDLARVRGEGYGPEVAHEEAVIDAAEKGTLPPKALPFWRRLWQAIKDAIAKIGWLRDIFKALGADLTLSDQRNLVARAWRAKPRAGQPGHAASVTKGDFQNWSRNIQDVETHLDNPVRLAADSINHSTTIGHARAAWNSLPEEVKARLPQIAEGYQILDHAQQLNLPPSALDPQTTLDAKVRMVAPDNPIEQSYLYDAHYAGRSQVEALVSDLDEKLAAVDKQLDRAAQKMPSIMADQVAGRLAGRLAYSLIREAKERVLLAIKNATDEGLMRGLRSELRAVEYLTPANVRPVLMAIAHQLTPAEIEMTPAALDAKIEAGEILAPNVPRDVLTTVLRALRRQDRLISELQMIAASRQQANEEMINREGEKLVRSWGPPGKFNVRNFAANYHALKTSQDVRRKAVASYAQGLDKMIRARESIQGAIDFLQQHVLGSPEALRDYSQAIKALGIFEDPAEHKLDGSIVYTNPLDLKDKVEIEPPGVDATGIEKLQNDYLKVLGWITDYETSPKPDPLRLAGLQVLRDKIENWFLNPADVTKHGRLMYSAGMNPFLGILKSITFGGRLPTPDILAPFTNWKSGREAMLDLTAYSEIQHSMGRINREEYPKMVSAVLAAAKAHGMTPTQWDNRVSELILGPSRSFNQRVPKVGEKLWSGETVLPEDVAAVAQQVAWIRSLTSLARNLRKEAIRLRPTLIREQTPSGRTVLRPPVHLGENMVPRRFRPDVQKLARDWMTVVRDPGLSDVDRGAALDRLLTGQEYLLTSHLDDFSDPEYRIRTPYKYEYGLIIDQVKNGQPLQDFNDLVDRVTDMVNANETKATRDEVRSQILTELTQVMRNISPESPTAARNVPAEERPTVDVTSPDNFMNKPAGEHIAPHAAYRYGVVSDGQQSWIMRSVGEMAYQRYVNNLAQVEKDITAKLAEYGRQMETLGRKKVAENSREEMILGNTAVDLVEAEALAKLVKIRLQAARAYHDHSGPDNDSYSILTTGLGAVVNSLLANITSTVARNATGFSPRQLFWMLEYNRGTKLFGGRVPVLSTAADLAKLEWRFGKALYQMTSGVLAQQIFKRTEVGRAAQKMLEQNPAMFEQVYGAIWSHLAAQASRIEMLKKYDIYMPELSLKDTLQLYTSLFGSGGRLPSETATTAQKVGGAIVSAGAMMARTGLPLGGFAPVITFADNLANSTAVAHLDTEIEDLKRLALTFVAQRDVHGINSSTTRLTDQEIFGRKDMPKSKAIKYRAVWNLAGINIDKVMIDYVRRYNEAKAAGKPVKDVPFLTDSQYESILAQLAGESNRSAFAIRNEVMKTGVIHRFLSALMGYNLFETSRYIQMASKATSEARDLGKAWYKQPAAVKASLAGLALLIAAGLIMATMAIVQDTPYIRASSMLLQNEEKQIPQFESSNTLAQNLGVAVQQSVSRLPVHIQLASQLIDAARGNTKNGLQLLPMSVYASVVNTARQAIQTGDPTQALMEFARQWAPNTKIVLNRLGSQEGIVNYRNVNRLLRANAPNTLEVRKSTAGDVQYSKYSAQITEIVNALGKPGGPDMEKALQLRDEIVQRRIKEDGMDPKTAQNAVDSAVLGKMPVNSVFGRKLEPAEYDQVRSRLRPGQLAKLDALNSAFTQYAAATGTRTASPTKASKTVAQAPMGQAGAAAMVLKRRNLVSGRLQSRRLAPSSGPQRRLTALKRRGLLAAA